MFFSNGADICTLLWYEKFSFTLASMEAAHLLQNLSVHSQKLSLGSADFGHAANAQVQPYKWSMNPLLQDFMDQPICYVLNGYPSTAYYYKVAQLITMSAKCNFHSWRNQMMLNLAISMVLMSITIVDFHAVFCGYGQNILAQYTLLGVFLKNDWSLYKKTPVAVITF